MDFDGIALDGTEILGRTATTGTIFRNARNVPHTLIGRDWRYLDLSEASFKGTIRSERLDATGVKLIGSQFPGGNFVNANFTNADLSRANFEGADLTGANFTGANLTGTNLKRAKLNNANFTRTTLASAILNNANLTGANFTEAPLFGRTADNRTRLHEATLPLSFIGANWSYLDLTKANLLNKEQLPANLNAAYVILDEVNLFGANLTGANLNHAQLKDTQLPSAILTDAVMNNGVFIGTIFTNASMRNANMENADITNADFTGAELGGSTATLKGATAVSVSFNHAFLVNMDFSDIKGKSLQGCNFSDACLVNAVFKGTTLGSFNGKVSSFANSCLQGADFSNANLSEVNLADAAIATGSGIFQATVRSQANPKRANYTATILPPESSTSARTVCPSGANGPCTVQKWIPRSQKSDTWEL